MTSQAYRFTRDGRLITPFQTRAARGCRLTNTPRASRFTRGGSVSKTFFASWFARVGWFTEEPLSL